MTEPIERLKRYGEDLAGAVTPARSRVVAMRAIARSQRRPTPWVPKIAATVGIFAIANVAAAGVADSAVPGDLLYPLDRTYENVVDFFGPGTDRSEERLHEAQALLDRSDARRALEHVRESIPEPAIAMAAAQVEDAVPDAELDARVAALIAGARDISTAARQGSPEELAAARGQMLAFAQEVAAAARHRGESDAGDGEDPTGPPPGAGRPDEPGPPPGIAPGGPSDPGDDQGAQGSRGADPESPSGDSPPRAEPPSNVTPPSNPGRGSGNSRRP